MNQYVNSDQIRRHCMVVHAYYPLGETRVERQAKALIADQFEVDVICLRKPGEDYFEIIDGVNIFRVPLQRNKSGGILSQLFEYLYFFVLVFFKLSGKFFVKRYSVVQVHNLPDFLVFSALIPKMFGSRIILDLHDLMPEFYASRFNSTLDSFPVKLVAWQELISCRFADRVITVTELWRKKLIKRGLPPEKVSVVMNVADHKFFTRQVKIERTSNQNGKFILIYHGNLTHRYGIDLAIHAIERLKNKIPEILMLIHGKGDYSNELETLVQDLVLEDHIHFSNKYMSVSELPGFVAQADLGVVPYRQDVFTDEILPTKLMEYTAIGLPVVISRNSAIMEYFNENMVLFFSPGDIDDLASCIYELYSDRNKMERLVENSGKFIQKYNWQNISESYVTLVKQVGEKE